MLDLGGNEEEASKLTDAIVPTIARLRRLQHLDLSGSNITDAAMPHIALLTNLKELNLNCCASVGQSGLRQLKGLTQLKISNLQADELGDDEYACYDDYECYDDMPYCALDDMITCDGDFDWEDWYSLYM